MPEKPSEQTASKRSYNSPVRRQQRENTRQKIIAAGAEIVHQLPSWDLQTLTFKAVGEQAGISERTVYRYFATEKQLKEAIVESLVAESGIDFKDITLSNFAGMTAEVFREISSYTASSKPDIDPTFVSLDETRKTALLSAVTQATPGWPKTDQMMITALLDMLWDIPPFQRLLSVWGLPTEDAIQAVTWLIGLIEGAIKEGNMPSLAKQ